MIWWISQPSRARGERAAIAELEEAGDWLRGVTWRLTDKAALYAEFELIVLGESVAMELVYPGLFPDVPPQVRPKDKVRLSGHQYGAGGELCLEYRPDNWEPAFTGAMLIESAYALLTGERPAPGETAEVVSAHRTTAAQEVRTSKLRFLVSAEARQAVLETPVQTLVEAEIVEHLAAGHWLAFPQKILGPDRTHWDASTALPAYKVRKGYCVRLTASLASELKAEYDFIAKLGEMVGDDAAKAKIAASDEELAFILEFGDIVTLMTLLVGTGHRGVCLYQTVDTPAAGARLPPGYARLAQASVAILGCGSMGSKIAASLARAGIGKFVLIDGDLMLPENLVRNDLDWDVVGLDKPDGVKRRIAKIAPSANVIVRRIELGGQESSAATDGALTQAGACDVIVDASADPQVFNLCGAIARNEKKPLVWGEVFAGGIGGIVGRLRPGKDPVPHAARRQILDWCTDRGKAPPEGTEAQYGLALPGDAPPLIADDADVTVIAAHVTKMVLDLLVHEETLYSQSAYAIGLRAGWIFEAPFDTWPIGLTPEGDWGPPKDDQLEQELSAFVAEFFPKSAGDQSE